ncbi:MAG: hypothetical protein B6D37_14880 [Sphingobacteriales bacterium UTBCD1]|nr:MAG: hypothetical protein B6D37_14880 [Sphingobacteriales bacterium UTBCD1]
MMNADQILLKAMRIGIYYLKVMLSLNCKSSIDKIVLWLNRLMDKLIEYKKSAIAFPFNHQTI